MTINFSESTKKDIRDLIQSIPNSFKKIGAKSLIRKFKDLNLQITDNKRFQCEIAFDNTVLLSETTIELIWCITYAHIKYYNIFCKGVKPEGQKIGLKHKDWELAKQMLETAVSTFTKKKELLLPENFPRPLFKTEIGVIFKYALLFFISHELFHTLNNQKFNNIIDEESKCDIDAVRLINNSPEDSNYLYKAKGICYGLMILNVYGIHTQKYDGKTHPFTYDRLIGNLELFFGKENDKIWGPAVAMFALHMTEKKIKQPQEEFETFYDCMLKYKEILKNASP